MCGAWSWGFLKKSLSDIKTWLRWLMAKITIELIDRSDGKVAVVFTPSYSEVMQAARRMGDEAPASVDYIKAIAAVCKVMSLSMRQKSLIIDPDEQRAFQGAYKTIQNILTGQ
jgi:1-acyl-sn-glycerol-3-phosphate acyltransferase